MAAIICAFVLGFVVSSLFVTTTSASEAPEATELSEYTEEQNGYIEPQSEHEQPTTPDDAPEKLPDEPHDEPPQYPDPEPLPPEYPQLPENITGATDGNGTPNPDNAAILQELKHTNQTLTSILAFLYLSMALLQVLLAAVIVIWFLKWFDRTFVNV